MGGIIDTFLSYHSDTSVPLCITSSTIKFWRHMIPHLPNASKLDTCGIQVRVWLNEPFCIYLTQEQFEAATVPVILDTGWRGSVFSRLSIPETLVCALVNTTVAITQSTLFPSMHDGPLFIDSALPRKQELPLYVILGRSGCMIHVNTLSCAVMVTLRDAMLTSTQREVEDVYMRIRTILCEHSLETLDTVIGVACTVSDGPRRMVESLKHMCIRGYSSDDVFCAVLDVMRMMGTVQAYPCAHDSDNTESIPVMLPLAMPSMSLWSTIAIETVECGTMAAAWLCSALAMLEAPDVETVQRTLAVPHDYVSSVIVPLLTTYANHCGDDMKRTACHALLKFSSPVWNIKHERARSIIDAVTTSTSLQTVLHDIRKSGLGAMDMVTVLDSMYVPNNGKPVSKFISSPVHYERACEGMNVEDIFFSIEHAFKTGTGGDVIQKRRGDSVHVIDVHSIPLPPCTNALACVAMRHPITKLNHIWSQTM